MHPWHAPAWGQAGWSVCGSFNRAVAGVAGDAGASSKSPADVDSVQRIVTHCVLTTSVLRRSGDPTSLLLQALPPQQHRCPT
jgi:hypothetical protein